MIQRRKHKRIDVSLPIFCKFSNAGGKKVVSSIGKVENLSLGGMKIKLPLHCPEFQSHIMDYLLELPKPYRQIKGKARIVWAYWNQQNQTTEVGMEMSVLDHTQRDDLETILCELSVERHKDQ
jgi:c-di-GMP-binding flagellar brake protein YcgR